ncbi:M23 family metallopeptidase [Alkalinema sp. FACHB-956]|uniref:murein hydrolase activator EnvC family protein n=1 Tax=Alkalinema sp. FACHB-956 TaxID=2692768 RepID=UPI00168A2EC9|nr:M23 family metallopeptidase [Alkalinema sp. FACHB-956]MBD2328273.1 peptidoglycan DD-metalloendopeptidase family protein [Alkalinema sp. FACHB-956]
MVKFLGVQTKIHGQAIVRGGIQLLCGLWMLWWAIGLSGTPAMAQNAQTEIDTLQQQRQQVEQQRQQIQQRHDQIKTLEGITQKDLSGLNQKLKVTTQKLQATQANLEQLQGTLKNLESELAQVEEQYRARQQAIVARLQFLQRQPHRQGLAILLQSQTISDFLSQRYRLKRLYEADRKALVALKQQTDQLEQRRNQVEAQKNQIAVVTQQLLAQKNETQAQADYQKQMITRLKNDRRALEAAIGQLDRDSEAITRYIRQYQGKDFGGIIVRGNGQMSYPIDAPITSYFGWRIHPILGYEKFHAGIDFGADEGTVIRAAAAGVVIYAGWYGGYGNTVIINHGNGITSLYAHTQGFYPQEGQVVQKGEPIAIVGSTGLSTGPHLHFEVRQNGEPIDPAYYL